MTDLLEYIKKMQEMYGDDVITTADKIKRPFKVIKAEDTKAAFDRLNNKIATQEAMRKAETKMAGPITTKNKKFLDEIVDKNGHLPYCNEDKHNLIDYSGQGYASSYRCQELEGEVAFTNILLKYGYEISLFNTEKYSNGDKIVIGDCPDIGVGLLGRKVSINGHEDEATGIVDRTNVIDSKPVVRINSKYYSMQDVIFL